MAVLNVSPTRMEMTNLKNKLEVAKRGHKLLKNKQDGLMKDFIGLIKKNKELRESVEDDLSNSFKDFLLASAVMSPEMIEEAVSFPKQDITVDVDKVNYMSVEVPKMQFSKGDEENFYPYSYVNTSSELDGAIYGLNIVMDRLLELAEVEKTCQLMADEIEKTRRRVNALEYRTIPDYEDTIKSISMKLDEEERASISRLMKVKDIIAENEDSSNAI